MDRGFPSKAGFPEHPSPFHTQMAQARAGRVCGSALRDQAVEGTVRAEKADAGGRKLASRTPTEPPHPRDALGSEDQDQRGTQMPVFKERDMLGSSKWSRAWGLTRLGFKSEHSHCVILSKMKTFFLIY